MSQTEVINDIIHIELNGCFLMEKYKRISGSMLKTLALFAMVTDHVAAAFLKNSSVILFSIGNHHMHLYNFMRMIGRIAFPIYSFLLVEGFMHTRNRKLYGYRLLAFALISEIPWNLLFGNSLFYAKQNVFFTLLLGYLGLCQIEQFEKSKYEDMKSAGMLLLLLIVSIVGNADYGSAGFGFILMMYLLNNNLLLKAVTGICILPSKWKAGLAFIPIALYNGKRGFINNRKLALLYYAVYPLHLLLFWIIKKYL